MLARFAVHPDGEAKDFSGLVIDDDSGIAATVLILRKATEFAHVHNDAHRFPSSPTVRAAA